MIEKVLNYDGHIHTPFCPHGSDDPFEAYIERAIALGLTGITFTEHAPLPPSFNDPTPEQDSAMDRHDLPAYITILNKLKEKYNDKIAIHIGLEVDYIDGYESETKAFLDKWGPYLDDAILSVHFLPFEGEYACLDYSPGTFAEIIKKAGSIDAVYNAYFQQVKKSILANLGKFKPRRIGHLTLVHKFKKKFPPRKRYDSTIIELLDLIKEKNYSLDYNGAGLIKPYCRETYPPAWVVGEAVKRKIPLIYGSDAHNVKGMAQGYKQMYLHHLMTTPRFLKGQP